MTADLYVPYIWSKSTYEYNHTVIVFLVEPLQLSWIYILHYVGQIYEGYYKHLNCLTLCQLLWY